MRKKLAHQPKTVFGLRFSLCCSLAIGTLLLIGGCSSANSPITMDLPSQEQKKEIQSNIAQENYRTETPKLPGEGRPKTPNPPDMASQDQTNRTLAKGKRVYQEHCASCHGVEGDGRGAVAADLSTRPQNFTKGVYKFRSTPSGQLPTDDDLFRSISAGIPGTAMDSYKGLPEADRLALVAYIKSLSPRFLKKEQGTPIIFPPARPLTQEAVTRGLHLYRQMACAACHGDGARGDGELAQDLTDTTGKPIRPADLTNGRMKSGTGPKAIYRTIMTGLDGTPMPSYGDSLGPEEGWDLALYILSLTNTKETL